MMEELLKIIKIKSREGMLQSDHMEKFNNLLGKYTPFKMQPCVLLQRLDLIQPIDINVPCLQILFSGPLDDGHWICMYYTDKVIYVYDSTNSGLLNNDHLRYIDKLFPVKAGINVICKKVQSQSNDYDCGIFAIANAISPTYSIDPCLLTYDILHMRNHVYRLFLEGKLDMFPCVMHEENDEDNVLNDKIALKDLYCNNKLTEVQQKKLPEYREVNIEQSSVRNENCIQKEEVFSSFFERKNVHCNIADSDSSDDNEDYISAASIYFAKRNDAKIKKSDSTNLCISSESSENEATENISLAMKIKRKISKTRKKSIADVLKCYKKTDKIVKCKKNVTMNIVNKRISSEADKNREVDLPTGQLSIKDTLNQYKRTRTAAFSRENSFYETKKKKDTPKVNTKLKVKVESALIADLCFDECDYEELYLGNMDGVCVYCEAQYFESELNTRKQYNVCCNKGDVKLSDDPPYPEEIIELSRKKIFLCNTRSYNNALAFACFSAALTTLPGIPIIKIGGQVYHNVYSLHPEGEIPRKYGQLYILDPCAATNERVDNIYNSKCEREIFIMLDNLIRKNNPYAESFEMMNEVEK